MESFDLMLVVFLLCTIASLWQLVDYCRQALAKTQLTKNEKIGRGVLIAFMVVGTVVCGFFSFFKSADQYYEDAVRWQEKNNIVRAIQTAKKAVEKDPEHEKAHRFLACGYALQRKFPEAIKEFKTALEIDPLNPDNNLGMAKACHESGDIATARIYYDRVLKLNSASQEHKQYAKGRMVEIKGR
jgi:Tfp pilus assembly protein PilF